MKEVLVVNKILISVLGVKGAGEYSQKQKTVLIDYIKEYDLDKTSLALNPIIMKALKEVEYLVFAQIRNLIKRNFNLTLTDLEIASFWVIFNDKQHREIYITQSPCDYVFNIIVKHFIGREVQETESCEAWSGLLLEHIDQHVKLIK